MVLSRRTFVYTSLLAGLSTIMPWDVAQAARRASLADMTRTTFLPHVDSRFSMFLGGERVGRLKLVEVDDLSNDRVEAFSLVFRGPRVAPLPQETYTVKHPVLGTFPLLLVPVGSQGVHYEAVFNRLRA
jgi:hypothetical protein